MRKVMHYSDIGTNEFLDIVGEIEVTLTVKQAQLFRRYVKSMINLRKGVGPSVAFFLLNLRITITCPRLLLLSRYYDPEYFDLIHFGESENGLVRFVLPSDLE